ncbi:hypothetical protein VaNZ11_015895 [Volvox africanus]|uniref:Uncharacterized protein n=1 Tax=Volvox africanus TaxID=51714 RepID=A0ABQ5SLK2_9CHLO|nr:hypothetical protein VaNZ11_015895 [Volvox africanus]
MWGCWSLPVVLFAPTAQSRLRPKLPVVVTASTGAKPIFKIGLWEISSYGNKGMAIGKPSIPLRRVITPLMLPPCKCTSPGNDHVLPARNMLSNDVCGAQQHLLVGPRQENSGERGAAVSSTLTDIWQRGAAHDEWLDGAAVIASAGRRHSHHTGRAATFLVRSIRTWREAAQLLDVAGGQEGCPPPRLQLGLLLQSRLFRNSVGVVTEGRQRNMGRSEPAASGETQAHGKQKKKQRVQGKNLSAVSASRAQFDPQDLSLWPSEYGSSEDLIYYSAEDNSTSLHAAPLLATCDGRRAMASGSPSTCGAAGAIAATAAADDASWQAHWELEWEVQVQRHATWLREPPPSWALPTSLVSWQPCSGALSQEVPQAAMRTCAAVMLPGHRAAALESAPSDQVMPSVAQLNQYCPIPPMRTLTPGVAPQTGTTANEHMRTNDSNQKQLKNQQQRPPKQKPRKALTEPVPEQHVGSREKLDFNGVSSILSADDKSLVEKVLLRVVHDAAVKQPLAWTNDEVATLLWRVTKIAYRYPCLLSVQTDRQVSTDYKLPQVAAAPAPLPMQRPSYRRNIAVGISSGQSPGVLRFPAQMSTSDSFVRIPMSDSGSGSVRESTVSAVGLGRAAVGTELRVWLQQLLLRVDGMLMPTWSGLQNDVGDRNATPGALAAGPGSDGSQFASAKAAAIRSDVTDPVLAMSADEAVTSLAVSSALWAVRAAAALQLRLSPEGVVRRRLLVELRTRRSSRKARRQQSQLWVETTRVQNPEEPQLQLRPYVEQPLGRQGSQPLRGELPGHRLGAFGRARVAGRRKLRGVSLHTRLDPSNAADMLWAFAMLGWQMPRFELDRALRVVSESSPRRLLLRPTRLVVSPAKPDSANPDAPTTDSVSRTRTCPARPAPEAARDEDSRATGGRDSITDGRGGRSYGIAGCGGVHFGGGRSKHCGLSELKPSQLTGVAWAAVQLNEALGQEGVTAVWAAQLFAATQTKLCRFSPSQLVDLMWSIGRGRRVPTGPWRREMAAALLAAAPRLVPWQAARAAAALAKLRVTVPYKVASAMLAALYGNLTAAQASDVAAMVWALPYITYPYTELFVRRHRRLLLDFAIVTQASLPSLNPSQLVQLVDGFARLQQLPGAEWMRQHREACIRLKSRFSEVNRRKIRQAYALMLNL